MSEEKSKKQRKKGIFQNYLIYILSFLIIALAVTVAALCIVYKPASELVHKVENNLSMKVKDITIDNEHYNPYPDGDLTEDETVGDSDDYGDKIGNITIESCGVNCSIYYGANRASWRNGAGSFISVNDDSDENGMFLKGYDETYFAGLKYAQVGDIITVTTDSADKQTYTITDIKYAALDNDAYQSPKKDELVLCSMFSVFSEHGDEYLYVFADKTDGEVS